MNDREKKHQVAILLYPGVTALDAVGPWEVFSRMNNTEVRFVGKETGPLTTEGGTLLLGVTHTICRNNFPKYFTCTRRDNHAGTNGRR